MTSKKRLLTLAVAVAVAASISIPAWAITYPTPDDGAHPQVGELLFYVPDAFDDRFDDPGAWFTCTGTLLSETVVLSAGHCTFAIGDGGASTLTADSPLVDTDGDGVADNGTGGTDVWVSFDEVTDFSMLNPSSGYGRGENGLRYTDWSSALDTSDAWHRGTANPHPDYNDAAFFLADAGVVVLDDRVEGVAEFAALPDPGHLDGYAATRRNAKRFTAVGYGLNSGFPTFAGGDTRATATMMLVSLEGTYGVPKGTSVVFSNNPGKPHTGGTCFGDSGGPVFDEDLTIVAVTSFGISFNCKEPGGFYRIDQADDLAFIDIFLP